jgi:hypothetical protein
VRRHRLVAETNVRTELRGNQIDALCRDLRASEPPRYRERGSYCP